MSIVEEYWSGALRRLQAEVDTFNRLVEHEGEKGRENELSLARVMESLIPQKYGVGSGLLIDADGNYSKQMDIVVFDQVEQPALLAQTNQVLFPVETVKLCIEVKTTVGKEEIEDATRKQSSVLSLNSRGTHPKFALVGYSGDSYATTLAKHLRASGLDFACVINLALIAARSELLPGAAASDSGHVLGVTPLHQYDGGTRVSGSYETPDPQSSDAQVLIDGHKYPVVKTPEGDVIGEPSRALLIFLEALLNSLTGLRPSILSTYISDTGREIIHLPKD